MNHTLKNKFQSHRLLDILETCLQSSRCSTWYSLSLGLNVLKRKSILAIFFFQHLFGLPWQGEDPWLGAPPFPLRLPSATDIRMIPSPWFSQSLWKKPGKILNTSSTMFGSQLRPDWGSCKNSLSCLLILLLGLYHHSRTAKNKLPSA